MPRAWKREANDLSGRSGRFPPEQCAGDPAPAGVARVFVVTKVTSFSNEVKKLLQGGQVPLSCEVLSEEHFAVAQSLAPAIVVIDVNESGMRGLETVYQARSVFAQSGIVAVGLRSSVSWRNALLECGADIFLSRDSIGRTLRRLCAEANGDCFPTLIRGLWPEEGGFSVEGWKNKVNRHGRKSSFR